MPNGNGASLMFIKKKFPGVRATRFERDNICYGMVYMVETVKML
jgi:hypothetical protein